MDPHDLFRAGLEAIFIELFLLYALALGFINCLGCGEALLLELDGLALETFNLLDLLLDVSLLLWTQSSHVYIWMLAYDPLLVLNAALLDDLAAGLLQHVVNLVLDDLVDLILAWAVLCQACVALAHFVHL